MAIDATAVRIINAYQDQTLEIRRQVLAYITRVWGSLDGYRDADIDRFVNAVVPVLTGGQLRTAQLTDGYLAAIEAATLGTHPKPVGVAAALVTDEAMRGVPAADVYQRAGVTVWTALSRGVPFPQAAGRGLTRAISLASTDLQLAKTHTSKNVFARNDRVVGYRRVLGGGDNCPLCQVASTQRYKVENLMPIHNNCTCDVEPIYGTRDPGRESTTPEADVTVAVRDHGELGPVLTDAADSFTAEDDLDN